MILCKGCKFIGSDDEFELLDRVDGHPNVYEAGMSCPSCGDKNVTFYTNKKLMKRQRKLETLVGKRKKRFLDRYEERFNEFQVEVAKLELDNGRSKVL